MRPLDSFRQIFIYACLLLSVVAHQQPHKREPSCSQCGNYCSRGNVSGYSGSISTGASLRAALEAISYKREIIFTIMTDVSSTSALISQLHNDLTQLCYDHFVILSSHAVHCETIAQASSQHVNCIWDAAPKPDNIGNDLEWLWHQKHKFITRAVRQGYNVLYVDADTMVVAGIYQHVKPPGALAHLHMITQQELPCGIQASFFYVQNVAPDGPVAWLFHDATEQPLRWLDDGGASLAAWGKQELNKHMCLTFDQAYLDDALKSAILGQIMRWRAIDACMSDNWAPGNQTAGPGQGNGYWRKLIMKALENATSCPGSQTSDTYIDHPAKTVMRNQLSRSARLVVPQGIYQPVLDGLPAGSLSYGQARATPGPLVQYYRQQLQEDCPTCPMWPEPAASGAGYSQQNLLQGAGGAPRSTELFAFAPRWFAGTVRDGGFHGTYVPYDGVTRAVFVHMHRFHNLHSVGWGLKVGIRKHYGMFNASLSRIFRRTAWGMSWRPQKLLVLHPEVQIAGTANLTEYTQVVLSILQMALLLGRTAVIPDVPCHATWMHHPGINPSQFCAPPIDPTHYNSLPYMFPPALVHGATPHGPRELRVAAAELLVDGCREMGDGTLNEPEWAHWQVLHDVRPGGKNEKMRPGPGNAVLRRSQALRQAAELQRGMLFLGVSAQAVLGSLTPAQREEPVLYLGHPVFLTDFGSAKHSSGRTLKEVYETAAKECDGLWESLDHGPNSPDWKLVPTRVNKPGVIQPNGELSV